MTGTSYSLFSSSGTHFRTIEANIAHLSDSSCKHDNDESIQHATAKLLLEEGSKYLKNKVSYGQANRDRLVDLVESFFSTQRDGILINASRLSCHESFKNLNIQQLLIALGQDLGHESLEAEARDGVFHVAPGKECLAHQALRIYGFAHLLIHDKDSCEQDRVVLDAKATAILRALGNIYSAYQACSPAIKNHILVTETFYNDLIKELRDQGRYEEAFMIMSDAAQATGKDFQELSKDLFAHVKTEILEGRLFPSFVFCSCGSLVHDLAIVDDELFQAVIKEFSDTKRHDDVLAVLIKRMQITGEHFEDLIKPNKLYETITKIVLHEPYGDRPKPITEEYQSRLYRAFPNIFKAFPLAMEDLRKSRSSLILFEILISTYKENSAAPGLACEEFIKNLDEEDLVYYLLNMSNHDDKFGFLMQNPVIKEKINHLIVSNFDAFFALAEKRQAFLMHMLCLIDVNEKGEKRPSKEALRLFGPKKIAKLFSVALGNFEYLRTDERFKTVLISLLEEMSESQILEFLNHKDSASLRALFIKTPELQKALEKRGSLTLLHTLFQDFVTKDIYDTRLYKDKQEREDAAYACYLMLKSLTTSAPGLPKALSVLSEEDRIILFKNLHQTLYLANKSPSHLDILEWVIPMLVAFQQTYNESIQQYFNPQRLALDYIIREQKNLETLLKPGSEHDDQIIPQALLTLDLLKAVKDLFDTDDKATYNLNLAIAQTQIVLKHFSARSTTYDVEIQAALNEAYQSCEEGSDEEIIAICMALILFESEDFEQKEEYQEIIEREQKENKGRVERLLEQANQYITLEKLVTL